MAGGRERTVMRTASGLWITGVLAALLLYMLLDALVRGEVRTALLALPWMVAAMAACAMLLVRPCIIVEHDALTIVNPWRTHVIPWRWIDDVQVRYQLVVTRTDGMRVTAWGSPTTRPGRPAGPAERAETRIGTVEAIERARDAGFRSASPDAEPSVRLLLWPMGIVVGGIVLGVLLARLT